MHKTGLFALNVSIYFTVILQFSLPMTCLTLLYFIGVVETGQAIRDNRLKYITLLYHTLPYFTILYLTFPYLTLVLPASKRNRTRASAPKNLISNHNH